MQEIEGAIDRRGRAEWRYKELAIVDVAQAFGAAIDASWLAATTLVPIPPSKAKGHVLHDDRMVRMLRAIPAACLLDIRELIIQQQSMEAVHNADVRPIPDDIAACYCIDETQAKPDPKTITLFDDVMTTGAHYVAAHGVRAARFRGVAIVGLFIARRVPETTDFSAFFGNSDEA
jgi:hypothetical protein